MDLTTNQKNKEPGKKHLVSALSRGLMVLNCFNPGDNPLGNKQIAERTGIPKATLSRLTHTLAEMGYLQFLPEVNKYLLGNTILGLYYALLAQYDVRRVARPLMQALSEHAKVAAVNLGVRDRDEMIYIDTYRKSATYSVQLDVGSRVKLIESSMGLAYLAALPEQERMDFIEDIRFKDEENWLTIKEEIDQALIEYPKKRFCSSLGRWRREINAVAVPLILEGGQGIMVFSCSGPSFELGLQMIEKDIGPRLVNLVDNVKTALNRY